MRCLCGEMPADLICMATNTRYVPVRDRYEMSVWRDACRPNLYAHCDRRLTQDTFRCEIDMRCLCGEMPET
ncbi:hypothetical protein J6590_014225 [Homalodisca vitripennis]|nr:hypothetical protein J6590_014225 [Homalodisca vitripennis]